MPVQMVFHPGNCLNHKKPYAQECKLCREACPHQAISETMEINARACTECGACMTVCPSDGFVDHTMDALYEYLDKTENISLNCPLAAPEGYEVPCLGILDRDSWAGLMLLAQEKPVKIFIGVCSECEDKAACAKSAKVFNTLYAQWPDHAPLKIIVKPLDSEEHESDFKREQEVKEKAILSKNGEARLELAGLRERGKEKLEELLPGLRRDETYNIPRARAWLQKLLADRPQVRLPFSTLIVNDSCTSCGVCTLICPQGALTKREENGNMRLVFEPHQCVHCNRCVETCRSEALKFEVKSLSPRHLSGRIMLHEGRPRYCSRCGKQVFDKSELCIACASSNSDKQNFFL